MIDMTLNKFHAILKAEQAPFNDKTAYRAIECLHLIARHTKSDEILQTQQFFLSFGDVGEILGNVSEHDVANMVNDCCVIFIAENTK